MRVLKKYQGLSILINDLRNSVEGLISQMGGKTHADIKLSGCNHQIKKLS